jgi:hypothetical protein
MGEALLPPLLLMCCGGLQGCAWDRGRDMRCAEPDRGGVVGPLTSACDHIVRHNSAGHE